MSRPPTLVLLVRHGTTPTTGKVLPGRARGLHLSDRGREQAVRAAERINELGKVHAVYASPLERARETAAPIGRADFGQWTGASLKRLMKKPEWSIVQRTPSAFRFPDGESFMEMQTRIVDAVDTIRRRHPGKTVVCVSHADPIKAFVAYAMGTPLDLFQRIVISTCSVTAVLVGDGAPIVLTVNSTGSSLKDLRPS
ncbi:MAG: phosphoglycerate mutase [Actinobacteria bacterium]|nr:phosphoglycerate mutase [Actinomycetota bacterium]